MVAGLGEGHWFGSEMRNRQEVERRGGSLARLPAALSPTYSSQWLHQDKEILDLRLGSDPNKVHNPNPELLAQQPLLRTLYLVPMTF